MTDKHTSSEARAIAERLVAGADPLAEIGEDGQLPPTLPGDAQAVLCWDLASVTDLRAVATSIGPQGWLVGVVRNRNPAEATSPGWTRAELFDRLNSAGLALVAVERTFGPPIPFDPTAPFDCEAETSEFIVRAVRVTADHLVRERLDAQAESEVVLHGALVRSAQTEALQERYDEAMETLQRHREEREWLYETKANLEERLGHFRLLEQMISSRPVTAARRWAGAAARRPSGRST